MTGLTVTSDALSSPPVRRERRSAHGALPVLRRCLRDAQHAVTCCDSVLWHAVSQHDAVTSCIVLHHAVMRQHRAV